jgi:hypothetical protein
MNFVTRSLCLRSNSNKILYPLHSALVAVSSLAYVFSFSLPIHFRSFFSSFYLNHQLFLAQHNGHYLCLNDLSCEERRHEKEERNLQPTIITTSCGYSVVVYYCVLYFHVVMYCLSIFAPQIIDISSSKARVSLCRFIDLASVLQQQQLLQPERDRERVTTPRVEAKEKSFYVYRRSFFYFIQIM